MPHRPATRVALLATALIAGPLHAQTTLTPPAQRISDEAIAADQRAYESMQSRIRAVNDAGRPLRDYHLAKAQCWLDVSFHEYTRNDRSAFPQAALAESEKLVVGMEQRQSPLPMDTALVNAAARLRPDLWAAAVGLRTHAGWRCAQAKAACAEVELVHAGNEHNQQQWRHAKPYVQIAEDLMGEARVLAEQCVPPPTPAPPVVAASPPAAAPAPPRPLTLAASVVFEFDRYDAPSMRPYSVEQLRQLVLRVRDERLEVKAVRLGGHADRLNDTGQSDYNLRLSQRRAATVRQALAELGLRVEDVRVEAFGDTRQVQPCKDMRADRKADLHECLLPNRRVDVVIDAVEPPR